MPVRQIPKNYRAVTGVVSSARLGRGIQFESGLERDFIFILDMLFGAVDHFEEQPTRVYWTSMDGREHSYVPDFLVFFSGDSFVRRASTRKPWLVEIKYREDLKNDWQTLQPKFRAAVAFAANQGWAFHVVTELEIRTPLLANALRLRTYRKSVNDPRLTALLIAALNALKDATVEQLLATLNSGADVQSRLLDTIWRLVATGQFYADIKVPLSKDTRVWVGDGENPCRG
jgi:hypothetical protein